LDEYNHYFNDFDDGGSDAGDCDHSDCKHENCDYSKATQVQLLRNVLAYSASLPSGRPENTSAPLSAAELTQAVAEDNLRDELAATDESESDYGIGSDDGPPVYTHQTMNYQLH
jgi:hypothetical protein